MFEIIRDIGTITRRIQMISNAEFRPLGLNNNAFLYLIRVAEQPGLFLGELADSLEIDRTTAFRTVRKLVDRDYLRLEDDAVDKRLKRVYVTEKGHGIYPRLHQFEQKSSDDLLAKLDDDQRKQLAVLLKKLV